MVAVLQTAALAPLPSSSALKRMRRRGFLAALLLVGDAGSQVGYNGDSSGEYNQLRTATPPIFDVVQQAQSMSGHATYRIVARFQSVSEIEDVYAMCAPAHALSSCTDRAPRTAHA